MTAGRPLSASSLRRPEERKVAVKVASASASDEDCSSVFASSEHETKQAKAKVASSVGMT